jgi:hypothetical protein
MADTNICTPMASIFRNADDVATRLRIKTSKASRLPSTVLAILPQNFSVHSSGYRKTRILVESAMVKDSAESPRRINYDGIDSRRLFRRSLALGEKHCRI